MLGQTDNITFLIIDHDTTKMVGPVCQTIFEVHFGADVTAKLAVFIIYGHKKDNFINQVVIFACR